MKSVTNARKRILQYPEALARCAAQVGTYEQMMRSLGLKEASIYGKCVASKENIGKSNCVKEFEALQECFKNSLKQMK